MAADINRQREITATVARFIKEHVDTLEKVELLALLIESSDKWWDAAGAAQVLGTTTSAARQMLERFAAQNLLAIRVTGDVRYQYQPGEPRLESSVSEFANAYHANRLGVLRLITEGRQSLRDFADAFRIRRDDDR